MRLVASRLANDLVRDSRQRRRKARTADYPRIQDYSRLARWILARLRAAVRSPCRKGLRFFWQQFESKSLLGWSAQSSPAREVGSKLQFPNPMDATGVPLTCVYKLAKIWDFREDAAAGNGATRKNWLSPSASAGSLRGDYLALMSFSNWDSVRIVTPRSLALSSLEPASSPTTT